MNKSGLLSILLILLFVGCIVKSQSNSLVMADFKPEPPPLSTLEAEEYAVYDALIEQKYLRDKNELIVIYDRTSAYKLGFDESFDKTIQFVRSRIPDNLEQELIDDFINKNLQSHTLKDNFNLKVPHVLDSKEEKNNVSEKGNSWGHFYRKYPNAHGVVSLSRVGFNRTLDRALVCDGNGRGPLNGDGSYILLIKKAGVWTIEHEVGVWIS